MNGKRTESHDASRATMGMTISRLAACAAAAACALALAAGAAYAGDRGDAASIIGATRRGEPGVIPLMQTRTLDVWAWDKYDDCDKEEFDESPDFAPYDSSIGVSCADSDGEASQQSLVERTQVLAQGAAHAEGAAGGGHDACGQGRSFYEFTFGAAYAESVLLSGHLSVEASYGYDPYPVRSYVEILDCDGELLFRAELIDQEQAALEFHETVILGRGASYTLRAEAYVLACIYGGPDGTAEFEVQLNALGDVDGDWDVDTADLLALLGAWGPNEGHPADFDGDGDVDTADLLALLGNWGP